MSPHSDPLAFVKFVNGRVMTDEIYGKELPCYVYHFWDAMRFFSVLFTLVLAQSNMLFTLLFALGSLIIFSGRTVVLAYTKLFRFQRLLDEEKNFLENNPEQGRQELTALYASRGFSGQLLNDIVSTLMADDKRVLNVMLQEKLGLKLYSQDHPILQGLGTFLGVTIAGLVLFFTRLYSTVFVTIGVTVILLILANAILSKKEKVDLLHNVIWNIAIFILAVMLIYCVATQITRYYLGL